MENAHVLVEPVEAVPHLAIEKRPSTEPQHVEKTTVKGRFLYLDGLRGVAALMVVYLHIASRAIHHFHVEKGIEYLVWYGATHVLDVGKIGVVLFFAISGFIIPESFSARSSKPVLSFAISRFFRLYPAYWLSLVAGLILYQMIPKGSIDWGTALANVTMLQTLMSKPDVCGVYWTLFIELVFYAVCAVAYSTNKASARSLLTCSYLSLCLALFGSLLRFHTHRKLPIALFLALSIMLWASTWRCYLTERSAILRRNAYVWLAIFLGLIPFISFLAYNFDAGFGETWYRYTISYYFGIGVFTLCTKHRLLQWAGFVWLGSVSYSVYLFHSLIEELCSKLGLYGVVTVPHVYVLVITLLTLLFAAACYSLIEAPSVKWGSRIRKSLLD